MSSYTPNFTQIPNIIIDEWIPKLKPTSGIVLLILCRKIYGWHKTSDLISLSQLCNCTGLSKPTVLSALEELSFHGLIEKHSFKDEFGHKPNKFSLSVNKPIDERYDDVENKILGGGSKSFSSEVVKNSDYLVVKNFDTQKKDLIKETLTKEEYAQSDKNRSKQQLRDFVFSFESKSFEGISQDDIQAWKEAYPSVNIDQELAKMKQWILSNPSKAKKLWRKFVTAWLLKSQDASDNRKAYNSNSKPVESKLRPSLDFSQKRKSATLEDL